MEGLDLLIHSGTVVDPASRELKHAHVGIKNGRIAFIGEEKPRASQTLDAFGLFVSPGFVDSHIHDEDLSDPHTVQKALLRQGVTTALAGNCGLGPLLDEILPTRKHPWIGLAYLTGHTYLREKVGLRDPYRPANAGEILQMQALLDRELALGSFGLSFGLEYVPGSSKEEIDALSGIVSRYPNRFVSIHIRHDGSQCVEALNEAIHISSEHKIRVQISHLGSMTAFGYSAACLERIDQAKAGGVDITFDCYPYDAFCSTIGSAVFDPGFEKRWNKGVESLEAATGKYKGQRLTQELFEELRREDPEGLLIAHVMNESEVRLCLKHPDCAIASDTLIVHGEGHPRAAGTFPRALRWLREEGLFWPDAIRHATLLPAEMTHLPVGRMEIGSPADLVIFDPNTLRDKATFSDQLASPEGIAWVLIHGQIAVEGKNVLQNPVGHLLLRDKEGTVFAR